MSDLSDNAVQIAEWSDLSPDQPAHAEVAGVDLVVIRWPDKKEVSVLFGRCQHRGALMADGEVSGQRLTCKLHGSTYRYTTGKNIHYPGADLHRFNAWIDDGAVFVDKDEISTWEKNDPQKYNRDAYLGAYQDSKGTEDEPHRKEIQALARGGLEELGAHGPMAAMGVSARELPQWKDLQILTAQLHRPPFALQVTGFISPDDAVSDDLRRLVLRQASFGWRLNRYLRGLPPEESEALNTDEDQQIVESRKTPPVAILDLQNRICIHHARVCGASHRKSLREHRQRCAHGLSVAHHRSRSARTDRR